MIIQRKRRRTGEEPRTDTTVVMTVSLFLILLTFFILLNSMAVIDDRKMRLALGSLIGSFGSMLGGLSPSRTGESILPPPSPVPEQNPTLGDLLSALRRMDEAVAGEIRIMSEKGRTTIIIPENFLYGEKLALKGSARPFLDRLSDLIRQGDYPVEVTGHTDGIPGPEKGYESNWELSGLMAVQVVRYLADHGAIPARRLSAYGDGTRKPLDSNDTRMSRSKNRRVEITLRYEAAPYVKRLFRRRPSGTFTYNRFDFKVF